MASIRLALAVAMIVLLWCLGHAIGGYIRSGQVAPKLWVIAGVAALVVAVLATYEVYQGGVFARKEERALRRRVLTHVFTSANLPKNAASKFNSARLLGLAIDNCESAAEYRPTFFGTMLAAVVVPLLTLVTIAVGIDWVIGVSLLAIFPLIPLLIGGFMAFFRRTSAKSRGERMKLSAQYLDAIRNLVVIRLFGAGERIEHELRDQGERNRGAVMKLLAANQIVIIVIDGLFSLLLIVMAVVLDVVRVRSGAIDLSQGITVALLTVLLLEPLSMAAGFFYIGMGGKASLNALGEYFSTEATKANAVATGSTNETDHIAPSAPSVDKSASQAAGVPGAIVIENLSYDYGRGTVLDNISCSVSPGERVVITGRSGVGKTTLLSLIRGSLPLQSGRIWIDGVDVATLDARQRRSLSASVGQTTWLLTGTIGENVKIGKIDATDDEVWNALRQAYIADDIARMPGGLDTEIGEAGGLISGGQAQRLSLARAFLSGRAVMILDEPTSQVDIESERQIVRALSEVSRDVTMIIVTHRRSLIDLADQIWTLDGGHLSVTRTSAEASGVPQAPASTAVATATEGERS